MAPIVLIVDDEERIRESLSDIFLDEGYRVIEAESAEKCLQLVRDSLPDLVLLDIWLSGMDGIEALEQIRKISKDLPVIMISGHANIEHAVKATKMGAYDFLEKPLSLERVLLVSRRAVERRRLEAENKALRETLVKKWRLIGSSALIKNLRTEIEMAAQSSSRVLVQGESGTGKEIVSRLLHEHSPRAKMPFVEVNCAAIPQELIESELFGHEKGSFTGAFEKKIGKFEKADCGALFLDEIGDMSLKTQAKVLRIIETQEFQRVGGNNNIKVDVRLIAATNKDLKKEVSEGRFREDLFFRLNVIPMFTPPLREHREDVPELVHHFLEEIGAENGRAPKKVTEEVMSALKSHDWPGNVRELRNTIERLVIMTPGELISRVVTERGPSQLPDFFSINVLRDAKDAFEKEYLIRKLQENGWNISKTAEILGVERSNLHRKIKAFDIAEPN